MPTKCLTPNRVGFVVTTAVFVMLFNMFFVMPAFEDDCETYHLQQVLAGPMRQDDPVLVRWVRGNMVPPSTKPYNLDFFLSGLDQEIDMDKESKVFSPSQEFILQHLDDIFEKTLETPGTFLEAGAYDGEFLSNTLYLEYEFGWKGVLVEANPSFFQQLLLKRRKSWAINACLNTKPFPSQEEFLLAKGAPAGANHVLNGPRSDPLMEKHISLGSSRLAQFKENDTKMEFERTKVQCVPLYTIVRALGRSHIDFFSLDVERAEMAILDTIPWDKLSFTVLAIEHPTKEDLVAYMDQRGYRHIASQLGDHIFINKDNVVLKKKADDS